jgi:outer membrane immunogenic protein
MYRVLTAALLWVVALGHAFAADLPPAPPPRAPAVYVRVVAPVYNWGGVYIGINGGWGFASGTTTATITGTGIAGLDGTTTTGSGSLNGGVAGGQTGANYQIDALVIGIEGDFDWSGQKRTNSIACGAACTVSETTKLSWIATIRGRFGYAIDRVLLFGTGGVAFTHASDNVTAVTTVGSGTIFNASSTNVGWTIGAGGEVALAQNWTAKIEYLYIGTNVKQSGALSVLPGTVSETAKVNDSLVRAGVNLKFP